MNKIQLIAASLTVLLLAACEQEIQVDISELHPFPGEQPVVFSFLRARDDSIRVDLLLTSPYPGTAESGFVDEAQVSLMGASTTTTLVHQQSGIYRGAIPDSIRSAESYTVTIEDSRFGTFGSDPVIIPSRSKIVRIDSARNGEVLLLRGTFSVPAAMELSFSQKLLLYGRGKVINDRELDRLPNVTTTRERDTPLANTQQYSIRDTRTVFDQQTRMPIDTILVDSVKLIHYTWGRELDLLNRSIRETSEEVGDGTRTIDGTTWTNIQGGYGIVVGYATDTVTVIL